MATVTFQHSGSVWRVHNDHVQPPASPQRQDATRMWADRQFGSSLEASQLLRGLLPDTDRCRQLRELLYNDTQAPHLNRMTDQQVITAAAQLLASGRLKVQEQILTPQARPRHATAGAAQSAASPVAAPTPRSLRPSATAPQETAAPETVDPTDKDIDIDQVAQAATLTRASILGTPFCEVCEKNRRNAANTPQRHAAA